MITEIASSVAVVLAVAAIGFGAGWLLLACLVVLLVTCGVQLGRGLAR